MSHAADNMGNYGTPNFNQMENWQKLNKATKKQTETTTGIAFIYVTRATTTYLRAPMWPNTGQTPIQIGSESVQYNCPHLVLFFEFSAKFQQLSTQLYYKRFYTMFPYTSI